MTFIAGPYNATIERASDPGPVLISSPLGIVEDGFNLEQTFNHDTVVGDNLGTSVQDGVYIGGDCFISFTLEEYDLIAVRAAIWPWIGAGLQATMGTIGAISQLATNTSFQLVLTVIPGSTANGQPGAGPSMPLTLTAYKAGLAENFPVSLLFAARLRRMPMRFRLLPNSDDVGDPVPRWFTMDDGVP